MVDEDIEELMEDWSVGDCASVIDYILGQVTPELIAIYSIKTALAVKKASRNSNQADLKHFMDLLEG